MAELGPIHNFVLNNLAFWVDENTRVAISLLAEIESNVMICLALVEVGVRVGLTLGDMLRMLNIGELCNTFLAMG